MGSLVVEASRPPLVGEVPAQFLDGLDQLMAAIDSEARLTTTGRRVVHRSLLSLVASQLAVAALLRAVPAIGAVRVDAPIIVTGPHRSGSTLLQRLLARHPLLRAPALWEQLAPADRSDAAVLVARAREYVAEYYRAAPTLPSIHLLDAEQPDECHRLLSVTFLSEIFELRYRVPRYGRWLAAQDVTAAYRYHRTLLRCLLWRLPAARLVLKCPFHLWHLDTVAAVYPDATVIRLHRDPAETIPSTCRLVETIRRARSDHVDNHEIGAEWLSRTASLLATTDRPAPPGLATLDVRYPDLVRDPVGVAARVCRAAGVPFTGEARGRMVAYLGENPAGRHGVNQYRAQDFGLDPDELRHRFARYRHTHGL